MRSSCDGIIRARRNFGVGHCQRAESLAIQLIACLADALGRVFADGRYLALHLVTGEQWKNSFRRTLRDENPLGLALDHDGEPPALEIERNLVALGVVFCLWLKAGGG